MSLTLECFSPLVGQTFTICADQSTRHAAALLEARPLGTATPRGGTPFSLMFEGPAAPLLPQRTYRFEHPALEAQDIFIVPVGQSPNGVRYEAVFT